METNSIPDYPRGITFEQVWAALMEDRERMKENDRKWDKRMREFYKDFGDLHNRFGDLAEHLVKPRINERFNELGYHFGARWPGGLIIDGEDGKPKAQIDLLLENGQTLMAVEVKVTPKIKHIEEHIRRLEILRDYRRKLNDKRQVEGAIAGAIFGVEVKKATIEAGLYVIEQSGDTMMIEVPDGFVPRRW